MSKNIYNKNLQICSKNPKTGYFRDGYCYTGASDVGLHTICAKMTNQFLKYTKDQGNDLITPNAANRFPGLKEDDHWCICQNRWKQAYLDGIDLEIKKNATHYNSKDLLNHFGIL